MNLQQLDHFLALVETQSFSRAADKLHLTQPALSRSISALEEELGGALMDRGKNKKLTALGELALVRARRVRVELAELRRSARILADVEGGTIRLGLGPAPTAMLSVQLLQTMMQRYPAIKVQLSGGTADMQLQELREGAVDALILHRSQVPPDDDLNLELFPPTPLGFVCRAGHPLEHLHELSFAELRKYPLAASGRAMSNQVIHTLNEYFGNRTHFYDAIQYQSNDVNALVELVRSTDAVFFGVLQVARALLEKGELSRLHLSPPLELSSEFLFVTLEGKTMPAALEKIRDWCAGQMGGEPG
ncbi:LysR family transcriptional regulator [Achromobacter seleniivolatilans]|uniref:LysR family transcriptional regulator n=1 Tax=Achromobacter seleniivolatilans TaxID=3047478 RepID=A0ABY9LZ38_9BURK|nr:LysR family transcriptional regulator [Achromobacter sp. R39]WMD20033.1 LysR family transcriptional regulator [Achromobacter sp. R39]